MTTTSPIPTISPALKNKNVTNSFLLLNLIILKTAGDDIIIQSLNSQEKDRDNIPGEI